MAEFHSESVRALDQSLVVLMRLTSQRPSSEDLISFKICQKPSASSWRVSIVLTLSIEMRIGSWKFD